MDDKELLELAAKAAGIGPLWYCEGSDVAYYGEMPHHRTFKPLTDDGDALRLAVKLGIGFIVDDEWVNVYRCKAHDSLIDLCEHYKDHNGNRNAATRRAIVRAAAQMANAALTGDGPQARRPVE